MRYQRNSVARSRSSRSFGSSASYSRDLGEDARADFRRAVGQKALRSSGVMASSCRKKSTGDLPAARRQTVRRRGEKCWAAAAANLRGEQRKPASARRETGEPPVRLPRTSLHERQQFVIGARLAHALDGVEIFQRVHAGQRLRSGHRRDLARERVAVSGQFVVMQGQPGEKNHRRGDGDARQQRVPVPAKTPRRARRDSSTSTACKTRAVKFDGTAHRAVLPVPVNASSSFRSGCAHNAARSASVSFRRHSCSRVRSGCVFHCCRVKNRGCGQSCAKFSNRFACSNRRVGMLMNSLI